MVPLDSSLEDSGAATNSGRDQSGPASAGPSDVREVAEPAVDAEPGVLDTPVSGNERRRWRDKLATAAIGTGKTIEKVRRSRLEAVEPDASGRWSKEHRSKLLRYVYERDDRRCGVCGAETRIEAAQVEHIVPKIFAFFDISKAGKAVRGTRYKSLLHKLDNLQASHTYCNKNKGNAADVTRWRHPTMPPLTVALAEDGAEFRVPPEPVKGH
ncbi:HNH endonuclease [Candidatus Poriferisodalis sp.]|uniref:HNH endonuclease n=1 Tax=Candidatus Poriferisodalis sp. TaxID=3101277 RepID=UPI003B52985A